MSMYGRQGGPVPIAAQARDTITRAGVLAQLAHRSEVRLLGDDKPVDGRVTVVIADDVDDATLRAVRAGRRSDGGRVVLIVTHFDEGSVVSAVAAGGSSLPRVEGSPSSRQWRSRAVRGFGAPPASFEESSDVGAL